MSEPTLDTTTTPPAASQSGNHLANEMMTWIYVLNQAISNAMAPINSRLASLETKITKLEDCVIRLKTTGSGGSSSGNNKEERNGSGLFGVQLSGSQFTAIIFTLALVVMFALVTISGGHGQPLNDFVNAVWGKSVATQTTTISPSPVLPVPEKKNDSSSEKDN